MFSTMTFRQYLPLLLLILDTLCRCTCSPQIDDEEPEIPASEMKKVEKMTEQKLVKLAKEAYSKQFYRKARFYYEQATRRNPSEEDYYVHIGYCSAILGEFEIAEDNFRQVLNMKPRNPKLPPNYQVLLCEIESKFPNANVATYYGNELFYVKKYEEALRCYEKAIERDPSNSLNYDRRGRCHLKLGNLTKAIEDLRTALSSPDHVDYGDYCRNDLAEALFKSAMYDDAIDVTLPLGHMKIARLADELVLVGKFTEALRAYTEAIARDPTAKKYYRLRGNCHTNVGNIDQALEDFQKAVEKDSNLSDSVVNGYNRALLSVALLNSGKVAEAKREMQTLTASQLITMADELALEKSELSDLYYSEAIEKDDKNVEYYEKRGRNFRQMNDLPKALLDFEKSVKIQSTCLSCWIEMIEVLVEMENYKEAKKVFKEVETNFENVKRNERIQSALLTMDKAEADAQLKKFKNGK